MPAICLLQSTGWKSGQGRDAAVAQPERSLNPVVPVYQPLPQQRPGELAASFNQKGADPLLTQRSKRTRKLSGVNDESPGCLQTFDPGPIGLGRNDHDGGGFARSPEK